MAHLPLGTRAAQAAQQASRMTERRRAGWAYLAARAEFTARWREARMLMARVAFALRSGVGFRLRFAIGFGLRLEAVVAGADVGSGIERALETHRAAARRAVLSAVGLRLVRETKA